MLGHPVVHYQQWSEALHVLPDGELQGRLEELGGSDVFFVFAALVG